MLLTNEGAEANTSLRPSKQMVPSRGEAVAAFVLTAYNLEPSSLMNLLKACRITQFRYCVLKSKSTSGATRIKAELYAICFASHREACHHELLVSRVRYISLNGVPRT